MCPTRALRALGYWSPWQRVLTPSMSLGTPSQNRKKTTGIAPPSKKRTSSSSSKNGATTTGKTSKSTKRDERGASTGSSKAKEEKLVKSSGKSKHESKSDGSKKSKKEELKPPKTVKPPTPLSPENEVEEELYEDDFEDYSDDFESDGSAESPKPVQRRTPSPEIVREESSVPEPVKEFDNNPPPRLPSPAKGDESEVEDLPLKIPEDTPMLRRLATAQGRREPSSAPSQPVTTPQKKETRVLSASERKIDFTTSHAYDLQAMSNNQRRYQKLRELITFDSVKYVLLDKPPVKDYDFYMQLFGDRGKMQTAAQTRDDDISQSIQTEQAVQRSVWTQAPAGMNGDWGGEDGGRREEDDGMSIFKENQLESEQLKKFVEAAAQVVLDLMASRRTGGQLLDLGERSDLAFSTGAHSIKLQPLAQEYRCTALTRNNRGSQTVTAAFLVEESAARDIEGRSLIVETILDCSRPPERLFLCDAEIACMCYSPDGSLLFVGMVDGSVAAFDLLESDITFDTRLPWIDSSVDIVLRRPSFDTSFLVSALPADGTTPIVSIHATSNKVSVLDASATLYLYGIQRDDTPRMGKTAGARLTVSLTGIVKPDAAVLKSASQPTPLIATCMAVAEEGQYVVGTDAGFLCSMSRSRTSTSHVGPRLYRGKMQSFGEVTALRVNPHDSKMLVAGLSTGSLQLIRLDQAAPILVLSPPSSIRLPVTAVEWSPTSNTGFYSWHGGTKILFWDISVNGRAPITTSDLPSPVLPGVSLCWLESSDQRVGFMAQALANGSVEVHALEPPRGNKMRLGSAVRSIDAV